MKQQIVKLIAALFYWTGVDALFCFLNRKAKRIITFHNVMPERLLPQGKRIGLTDTEESFTMKIHEIGKHFQFTTDISDNKGATITFDDGYRNQYEVAAPLMENAMGGIIFACGKLYDNASPSDALVVDLLMHWTWLVPNGEYAIDYHTAVVRNILVDNTNRDMVWQKAIWPSFVKDNKTKGYGLLNALNSIVTISSLLDKCDKEYLRLRLTGFSSSDMEAIRKAGWLVGWHTYEHFPLSALDKEEKLKEIDTLAPTGTKAVPLSYPYGEIQSVDNGCQEIAKRAGYQCAVSNLPDANAMTSIFFLPRITLSDNKYLLHFELSGTKYFMKNRSLMPVFKLESKK